MYHLHRQPPPHSVDPGAHKLQERINILRDKVPPIHKFLSIILPVVVNDIIIDYLLHHPLNKIKKATAEEDQKFTGVFVQDDKDLWNKYSSHKATKRTLKIWTSSKLLNARAMSMFRILEFWELNGCLDGGCQWKSIVPQNQIELQGIFPTDKVLKNGYWKGISMLIPITPMIDRLVFFLQCKSDELNKLHPHIADVHNLCNEMEWGWADQQTCFYFYKQWVLRFFYDMTISFLFPREYYQTIEKEPLTWYQSKNEDYNAEYYHFEDYELHREFTFPVQWDRQQTAQYYLGIFKRRNPEDELSKWKMNYYCVKIANSKTGQVLYRRGSALGVNPISAIVLHWLSMTDDELGREINGFIRPYSFRKMILRFIYYLHDWN